MTDLILKTKHIFFLYNRRLTKLIKCNFHILIVYDTVFSFILSHITWTLRQCRRSMSNEEANLLGEGQPTSEYSGRSSSFSIWWAPLTRADCQSRRLVCNRRKCEVLEGSVPWHTSASCLAIVGGAYSLPPDNPKSRRVHRWFVAKQTGKFSSEILPAVRCPKLRWPFPKWSTAESAIAHWSMPLLGVQDGLPPLWQPPLWLIVGFGYTQTYFLYCTVEGFVL